MQQASSNLVAREIQQLQALKIVIFSWDVACHERCQPMVSPHTRDSIIYPFESTLRQRFSQSNMSSAFGLLVAHGGDGKH